MLNLFNLPFAGGRTPPILPLYEFIMERLTVENNKVLDFYHSNAFVVPNNHILVKVVAELNKYMDLNPETMVEQIVNNLPSLERVFGFNSSVVDSGYRTDGSLYNRLSPEVWISVENEFDVEKCLNNWEVLQPIRCVAHSFTDLTMGIPNGRYIGDTNGTVVVTIDIAMLAIQYKGWRDNKQWVEAEQAYRPLHQFIYQYPLTNLTSTQTDVAIFNRLHNTLRGIKNNASKDRHSFQMINFDSRIDDCNNKLLELVKKRPFGYITLLNSIPSIKYGSYYRATSFPDMASTRQVKWALILARLKMIEFLLESDSLNPTNTAISLSERDIIARELRSAINAKTFAIYPDEVTVKRIKDVYAQVNRETP